MTRSLSPEIAGAIKAVTEGIMGWARPEIDALRKHVGALEMVVERMSAIGDPTPSIETLAGRIGDLETLKESISRTEGEPPQTGSLLDDDVIKSIKHQLTRHRDHLQRLQDRILRLEQR